MNGRYNNSQIYTPLSELFGNFLGESYFQTGEAAFVPPVNIIEEKNRFLIEFSIPGFSKEDFNVEWSDQGLQVSGTYQRVNEAEERTYTRKEFNLGSFSRQFNLPDNVNENEIEAKYENGILTLTLPKAEPMKKEGQKVKIQ